MTAIRAGITAYNAKDQVVRPEWDSYQARLNRYAIARAYYDNTAYKNIETFAASLKLSGNLYRKIRGIKNPVNRAINLYMAYAYQGKVNMADLSRGAVPLIYDNRDLEPALRKVIRWSNLGQNLSMYTQHNTLLGDSCWWVSDDPMRERIRMEVMHPSKIKAVERDEVGNVRSAIIEYQREEQENFADYKPTKHGLTFQTSDTYLYTLTVDKEWFATYKDGEPYPFYFDADGNPLTRWPNKYGFVPLKLNHFESVDDGWGQNSFYSTLTTIDELNDQASIIDDTIRRVIEPILKAKGLRQADVTVADRDDKSGITMLYISSADPNVNLEPLVIPIDISAAAANAKDLEVSIESSMPLLALQRIREGGQLTAPGVRTAYGDAIAQVEKARMSLDAGLVAALQMAVTMGAVSGYEDFRKFNADSYDDGDMELEIAERPVINDTLAASEKLTFLSSAAAQPVGTKTLMLKEMGYSSDEIKETVAADAAQTAQQTPAPTDTPTADTMPQTAVSTLQPEGMAELIQLYNDLGLTDLLPAEETP